jgi:arylsulfatase A-like enzyme
MILTDDQRYDSLQYMPNVESQLVAKGVTFTNSFDNNPLCCPSRTTILTGQTSGHNGVWWNHDGPTGGFDAFRPHGDQTIFRWLHDAGYYTGLVGKFLNGYKYGGGDYHWVMPGVDQWDAFLLDNVAPLETGCNSQGYWATCYSHNGVLEQHSSSDYSCPSVPQLRPSSYDRTIQDGPSYMQVLPALTTRTRNRLDGNWVNDCRTLLSVDDQVGNIIDALRSTGRLSNTLIMYTSDNGYLFGEHRWIGKIVPYEESVRVPVVIRADYLGTNGTVDGSFITNMDYTATMMDAAGVGFPPGYQSDGQSMLPLVGGPGTWNPEQAVLIEHAGGTIVPTYCGIRTADYMYAQYATGEEELYDLSVDPNQNTNVASDPAYQATLVVARAETHQLCDPLPPGFTWTH